MSSNKLVTSAQVESLRTMANAKGVSRKAFQEWLDNHAPAILDDLKSKTIVTMVEGMFSRHVTIDRNQASYDFLKIIKATGRKFYIRIDVAETIPKGDSAEVDIVFFKPEPWEYTKPGWMSDDDLEKCFELRNLEPADPYSLAKVNEDDSAFADEYPNSTHWKDDKGRWCFISFELRCDERRACVFYSRGDWSGDWWFAGIRKVS